ncbi:hypothetical protein A2160_06025 [Candidatus Beckwithbacteria bacterium RBG_13_42_9]|uniref:Pilus assembly protein PilO n=1 Tax=Candidatus Beckwithbacteria bacterium RBG_13_42_9 TaxID=1797457 RepID=A0A1F5E5A0_9BACT|nr:MAG: hypothetical protein A2160_06025 [Candidatus Beckwithbacteria bacterium RBG_13_42_9]
MEKTDKKTFQLNPKWREKLVPLAVVIIVVLGSALFGGRLLNVLVSQQLTIQENQQKVSNLKKKLSFLEETNQAALQQQVVAVENVLPSYKPALNLLLSLSKLAHKEKVILSGITINPGKIEELTDETENLSLERSRAGSAVPTLKDFTIDFTIEGTLSQLGVFITELEKTTPIMKIEKLSLSLPDNQPGVRSGSGPAKIGLTVKVFYQKPPTSLGAVADPLVELTAEETKIAKRLSEFVFYQAVEPTATVGKQNIFTPPLSP